MNANVLKDISNDVDGRDEEEKTSDKKKRSRVNCADCDRSFASSSSLNRHKNDVHDEGSGRRFVCPDCPLTFKRPAHLEGHRLRHHLVGEKPLFCEFCSKSFTDPSFFKRHQRAHKGETPFSCPYCQKGFAHSKTQLRNHVMTHTGERPFRCDDCRKGFITKVELTRHSKKCGRDEELEEGAFDEALAKS